LAGQCGFVEEVELAIGDQGGALQPCH
jgi:hypothetical protein